MASWSAKVLGSATLLTALALSGGARADDAAPKAGLGGPGESCRARTDCAEGLKCVNQTCTDAREGQACEASSECGGLKCIAKRCTSGAAPPSAPPPEHEEKAVGSGQRTAGKVLFISGIALFGAGWLATGIATTAIVAGNSRSRTAPIGEAWVPLAGPYIMLADSWDYSGGQVAATASGAVIQTLGFTSMVVGIVLWAAAPSAHPEQAGVVLVPWSTRSGGGLSLGGTF